MNQFFGIDASSPIVAMPSCFSLSFVLGPIPGILIAGKGERKSFTSSPLTTVNPAGFLKSEAIFAISLFGPTPILHDSFSFSTTSFCISIANCAAFSKSSELLLTSRYASSMLTCSNFPENFLSLDITCPDASIYFGMSTGRNIAFGFAFHACDIGIAERIPNFRAG